MADQPNGTLYNEIRNMVESGSIETADAVRLLLLSHAKLLADFECVRETLKQYERYPSITWMWAFRRKEVIVIVAAIFLLYTFLFSPINISTLREAVLHMIGLQIP